MNLSKLNNTLRCRLLLSVVILLAVQAAKAEVSLIIDKASFRMTVVDGTDTLARYPVAVGRNYGHKQGRGDMKTPEGTFTIRSIEDSQKWGHDFKDGKGYIRGAYGPWFMRLSYGSGIGIHGTHDPLSMGKRATEGCIRLRNEDLRKLREMVKVGTKVHILPDPFSTPWTPPVSQRKRQHERTGEPIGMPAIGKLEMLPAVPFAIERSIEVRLAEPQLPVKKRKRSKK